MQTVVTQTYEQVILEIDQLDWQHLSEEDLTCAAWAYYFFSVQFRENLKIARSLYPNDKCLENLEQEECDTDNLSPWPGVARPGEPMNHDEFMRRVLALTPIPEATYQRLQESGQRYLAKTRAMDAESRAMSLTSYEDGGLEQVFRAMLTSPAWDTALLRGFQHFLSQHIKFDSDPEVGHGAMIRHLQPDDRILPLWVAFRDLLIESVPSFA